MRVLAITNLYPNPWQPNRATFNRHQFRILNERYPVRVIAPISWTDERKARRTDGPRLSTDRRELLDGLVVDHPRYWFPPKVGRGWYGRFFRWSVRRAFQNAVAEFQPDIVFAPWAYPDGWAAVRLGHAVGLPVVLQCHGSDILLVESYPARRRPTVEAVTTADGVVAVSHDIASKLQAFGISPERLRTIHDGVDLRIFSPGSREDARQAIGWQGSSTFGIFIGNLVSVKAVDVLLNAWAELMRSGKDWDLAVIGDGPLRRTLETLAHQLGLQHRVTFRGAIPHGELPAWYRSANLLILPSHSEGVPNVLLEASACGTPWVASRVGGIPEIAHLGNCWLVPPGSPGHLSEAISSLISSVQNTARIPQKAREAAVEELAEFLIGCQNAFRARTR